MHTSISGAREIIKKIFAWILKIFSRVLLKRKIIWRSIGEIFRHYFWKNLKRIT
jgi:hypothetical protein